MIRLLDPLGLVAGTWHRMGAHRGDGFGALLAVELVVALQLLVPAALLRPVRTIGILRSFVQHLRDRLPQALRPT